MLSVQLCKKYNVGVSVGSNVCKTSHMIHDYVIASIVIIWRLLVFGSIRHAPTVYSSSDSGLAVASVA